jgi:hypothetical protein
LRRYFQQNLLRSTTLGIRRRGGRSVSIKIERRVSGVITRLVSPGTTVKLETFKGRKLKIVQTLEQAKARIFRDIKFSLSEHASGKEIWG